MRRILVGAERERLDAIEAQQPVISAESVGAVLPDAAVEASRHHRHELSVALEPTLTTTIRQVVERDSELFGAILSPAIGAAVRRAVREAFDALVQRIDETLAVSLSPESIAWRIEARRTGRPLAEIVLARTLLYRVEQVFLIHSPSGVALRHVAVPGVGAANPDQVASMLSAIDAFVVEAFSGGEPAAHVGRFEAGGLTVWVDRDPLATIAAVVRGRGPSELGDMLCHARERISVSQRPELERFVSEVELFAPSEPVLEECLVSRTTPPSKRPRRVLGAVLALVALAALGALGAWQWRRASDARQLARSVAALEAEPGIVVLSASGDRIEGLRDPLAPRPEHVLARRDLRAGELAFVPFDSRHPALAEQRVRAALRPPDTVDLTLLGGELTLAGEAPPAWIERARVASSVLPDVSQLDDSGLVEAGARAAALEAAIRELEAVEIPFAAESAALRGPAARAAEGAARHARAVLDRARAADAAACIAVVAGAREGGGGGAAALRRARATTVAAALEQRGVPRAALEAEPSGSDRRVRFDVRSERCEEGS